MSSNRLIPRLPDQFSGKWHHKSYTILKELGRGANGAVYLALCSSRKVAVKVGADPFDLLIEVNMLKSVDQDQSLRIGPRLYEVDDLLIAGRSYSFYAMEYVEGERLDDYVDRIGRDWVVVLLIQVLTRLEVLHQQGWVFGDVKPDNILVGRADKQVHLIDFGGVSQIGRAVRQFTEDYDRAVWQAGDRRAEPSYDLFAVALMMIRLSIGRDSWHTIRNQVRHLPVLYDIIRGNKELYLFREPILKALNGNFASAEEMKRELVGILCHRSSGTPPRQRGSAAEFWIGGLFVASLLLLASSLYYLWM
ncbi:protein kinase [Brevibacillus humidisoli]|uniref:serine/threonine protein kinase n=1 Tax=Brevibacillus humidisoli TaxID=2895522 RepID=UPI001E4FD409|nr:protein kinase [Brevibacillus humidisoli]UFJ40555.1 protein kinase [Brevibacillus humidisoli]